MNYTRPALLVIVLCFTGCDCLGCGDEPAAPDTDAEPTESVEQTVPAPEEIALRPARAEGTLRTDDTPTLRWTHAFDANQIVDAAQCGSWFYTVTKAGRLVRYDIGRKSLEEASGEFHSVTAVNAIGGQMVVGTEFGTLARGSCRLTGAKEVPETLYPVRFAQLDPRSRHDHRAFVVFERIPGHPTESDHDPVETRQWIAAHVDLGTGRRLSDEFIIDYSEDARPIGYVDYRGEFWLGLSSETGANSIWHLERFGNEPPVAGLEEAPRLNGFAQVGRRLWAFLGSESSNSGWIVRVDSNRARTLWDGEKFKTGQHAGGDVPKNQAVTLVTQKGKYLWVLVPDGLFQTDMEMRRWKRLGPKAPKPIFDDVRGWAKRGDGFWVATPDGLAFIDPQGWRQHRVPVPIVDPEKREMETYAEWAGRRFVVEEGRLHVPAPIADDVGASSIDGTVRALALDDDRMWVLSTETLTLFRTDDDGVSDTAWRLSELGLDGEEAVSLRKVDSGSIEVEAGDETVWTFQLGGEP